MRLISFSGKSVWGRAGSAGEGVVEGDEGSGKSWRGEGMVGRGYEGE